MKQEKLLKELNLELFIRDELDEIFKGLEK